MPKAFYVKVYCFYPYKIEQELTIPASTFGTAIRRALNTFRKHPKIKGKQVPEFFAQARSL